MRFLEYLQSGNLSPAEPHSLCDRIRLKTDISVGKLVKAAASYLENEFGVNFDSHIVIKSRLADENGQISGNILFHPCLPNFWSGQLTKMLYHSSELGTFLLHLVLMEAEEIIILNIKKKIIGENHFSRYLPLQKSAFVCSLIEKSKLLR